MSRVKNRQKILFICGSMNQTTMMVKIARHLLEAYDCWFTPYYTDGYIRVLEDRHLLEWTVAGNRHKSRAEAYLRSEGLQIDVRGQRNEYDLVLTCSDLVVPKNILRSKIILVQEGMTDPENATYRLVRSLRLPRYLASTATFGLSHAYDVLCVASEGYRDHFINKGVDSERIRVTGIPNFDNCIEYAAQPCEYENFVLVATSDSRETFKYENRKAFLLRAAEIAAGRQLIVKLHPNENHERATREIERYVPGAIVLTGVPIEPLIARCEALVTKYSSCVYVGIALGREVYSDFALDSLRHMCPIQNAGTSAASIARECVALLNHVVQRADYVSPMMYARRERKVA
jgi:hypothetical protein